MNKRTFIIGSNWLFYKIFASPNCVDNIISQKLPQLIKELKSKKLFDKWFFIRYDIPEFHLRIRFYSTDSSSILKIILVMKSFLENLLEQNLCYNVQIEPYEREMERYGGNTMEHVETLFYLDSEFIMNFSETSYNVENENNFRWLFSLILINQYLNLFKLSKNEKFAFISSIRDSFWVEHGLGRKTKFQIDRSYRQKSGVISEYINEIDFSNLGLSELGEHLDSRKVEMSQVVEKIIEIRNNNQLEVSLWYLLSSLVHMTMNRIFISKNRLHEVVCYDFLKRHYKSELARDNKMAAYR